MFPPLRAIFRLKRIPLEKKGLRQAASALAVTFLIASAVGQTVTADFASRSGKTHTIQSRMFGFNMGTLQDANTLSTVAQAGITEGRTMANITSVYATSQPDWRAFDWKMRLLQNAGLHPLMTLVGTPPWMQPTVNPCAAVGSASSNAAPLNISAWAKIAASYVAHMDAVFPGFVHYYEIWNEPELQQCFCVGDNLDSTRLSTYLSLYAAAASAMRAQALQDGVHIYIGGPVIAKFSLAGEWIPALLSNPSTYPYVDFISYHMYLTGTNQIGSLMNWSQLYGYTQSSTRGELLYYLQDLALVRKGQQLNPPSTPIFVTEFNDNWVFAQDCCRNHPAYGPLWNSVAVVDFLNSVYAGANTMPTKMFYFAGSAPPYFCIAGKWNANMDCDPSSLDLYPQFYAYKLLASPAYLGLSGGGHMALSVSPVNTSSGLLATAFYNSSHDAIVVVNPTSTSYTAVKVVANNAGFSTGVGKLFTLNQANPHIATGSVALTKTTSGYQATIAVPAYSTVAVTIAP